MNPPNFKQRVMEAITLDGNFLVRHNNLFFAFLNKIINSCDVGHTVRIGKNLQLAHRGISIIIGQGVEIGDNCFIGHNVTIGSIDGVDFPVLGNNVRVNCNAVLVGNIKIGDNSIIGANSYIDFDIKENKIVYPKQELKIYSKGEKCRYK